MEKTMKLIVKNGQIVATHNDNQDVIHLYPGATDVLVPDDASVTDEEGTFLALDQIQIADPWPQIRKHRDQLLAASDWAVLPDSPLTDAQRTEAITYRQALRDLPTAQSGVARFEDIVWPEGPEELT
jgi:hypothetical protein